MKRIDVSARSSDVRSIGFETRAQKNGPAVTVLEVEFSTGAVYQYDNVTNALFDRIIGADSIGSTLACEVTSKPKQYPYRRIVG